jgi:hypothetical protein
MSLASKFELRKLLAERRKAERDFVQKAKAEGLSNAEIVERVSMFPKGIKPKVVKWPKF